jgi:ribonuclease HI
MELMAVVEALQALRGNDHTIRLFSDSKYVVDAFVKDWIGGWKRRAWKNVKNIDLWQRLLPLTHQHQITWCWIKGHAEIPENERCDVLAKAAAASSTLGPDLGYRANSL